jgi:hypothetical protein
MAGYPRSYLYSSSRGKCFYGMACHEVHVKPGGKLDDLCQVAISRIGKTENHQYEKLINIKLIQII